MKKLFLIIITIVILSQSAFAQMRIGDTPRAPEIKKKEFTFRFHKEDFYFLNDSLKNCLADGFDYYFSEICVVDSSILAQGVITKDSAYIQIGGILSDDILFFLYDHKYFYCSKCKIEDFEFDNILTSSKIVFDHCNFEGEFTILGGFFENELVIHNSNFRNKVTLGAINFEKLVRINNCNFFSDVNFISDFENGLDISFNQFYQKTIFNYSSIKDTLSFVKSKFSQEIDLLLTDLDSLNSIYLDEVDFKSGNLNIDWNQIKMHKDPIIKVYFSALENNWGGDSIENLKNDYIKTQKIYEKLEKNYLSQNKNKYADNVAYELQLRKQQLLGGFFHNIYYLLFGFGYQPWRFLILLSILVLIVSIIYLIFYQNETMETIYSESKDKESVKVDFFLIKLIVAVKLSAWIFFSVSFNKSWINFKNKKFVILNFIHWILGILAYVSFAIFVKNTEFGFIKDILGF